jgi:DNA polymerase (family 10)
MSHGSEQHKTQVDNACVARVLRNIAAMLEFQNENAFKFRAYQMAAETIESLQSPVAEMVERGGAAELQKIPGVGKGISAQIVEIIRSGSSSYFAELTKDIPASVLDLRRVSGVGLKTAQLLYRDFGVKGLDELEKLANGGGLASVPGLGEKSIARIKSSLARLRSEQSALKSNQP